MGWGNMLSMIGGGGLMFVNPALGAGVMAGSLKNMEGQNKADRQRAAHAEIQRWSPWTGLQGQQVQDPSLMGDLATGAALGGMGQKMFAGGAAPIPGAGDLPAASQFNSSSSLVGQMPSTAMNPDQFSLMGSKPSWLSMASQQGMNSPYSLYSK